MKLAQVASVCCLRPCPLQKEVPKIMHVLTDEKEETKAMTLKKGKNQGRGEIFIRYRDDVEK
jgi:hypothetical protein